MRKPTLYSSLETDAEYRPRLRGSSPDVTPRAAVGVRVSLPNGDEGEIIDVRTKHITDIFVVEVRYSSISGEVHQLQRQDFRVLPLDINTIDSVSLDKIGDMVGVQRKIVERIA